MSALEFDFIHWKDNGDGSISPLETPLNINYPSESNVKDGIIFGALNDKEGTLSVEGGDITSSTFLAPFN
jgi:hypothetical protein